MDQFATQYSVLYQKYAIIIKKILNAIDFLDHKYSYYLLPYIVIAQFGFKFAHSAWRPRFFAAAASDLLQIGISLNRNGLGYAYR